MVGANDVQLRIFFEHALAEFFSAFWTAAEEVVREFGWASREEFSQKAGAINAVLKGGALAVQAPDEGHSIGDEEVDAGCGGGECGVVPPHGDDVGIGKIDCVGAGLSAAGEQLRAEGFVIGAGEVGGEDAAGGGHAGESAYALRDSGVTGPLTGRRSYAWRVTGGEFVEEKSLVFWELRESSEDVKMARRCLFMF